MTDQLPSKCTCAVSKGAQKPHAHWCPATGNPVYSCEACTAQCTFEAMQMSKGTTKDLLPCPFCGAGETLVEPDSKHWAGTSWNILSWQVRHWCKEPAKGVRGSMVIIRAKTEPEVIDKWNQRA